MEEITIQEALERTVNLLEGIEVPIRMMDRIGKPIAGAVNNLRVCIDAIAMKPQEATQNGGILPMPGENGADGDLSGENAGAPEGPEKPE